MGGLSGIHPIARVVASIVEAGPVEIVANIELISLRSDMKMRTRSGISWCPVTQ